MGILRSLLLLAILLWALTMLGGCGRQESERPEFADPAQMEEFSALWEAYKRRFVRRGRVLDIDNGGISHSEGQGYGMLLAEAAGDRATFDALFEWTVAHLQRKDGLFAWRYGPCSPELDKERIAEIIGRPVVRVGDECISDPNNASDGEILIAWALLRAAARWHDETYLDQAARIADASIRRSVIQWDGRLLLLPGLEGFDRSSGTDGIRSIVVNPSYWVFPALDALAAQFPDQPWRTLSDNGLKLIRNAGMGERRLPPDWLELGVGQDGGMRAADGFEPVYGFNAVRIPLHLVWGRKRWLPEDLEPFLEWWSSGSDASFAAWLNLENGEQAGYAASAGVRAIASVVTSVASGTMSKTLVWPEFDESDGYFSWSLGLLARVALMDSIR